MKKQILALLFGVLVAGLMVASAGQAPEGTISGQVTKSSGGSDWSMAASRSVTESTAGNTVSFSASGYYSGLSTMGGCFCITATAQEGATNWVGKVCTCGTPTWVDIVASPQ